ncbi:MAG: DUF4340 domain-containing protein [Vicinamibacterales bacterium]
MKRAASTLILVVVLAGLGGYIYFVENRKPATDPDAKAKAFEAKSEDIEELQITIADGGTSTLKKIDDRWQIVDPVQAEADNSEINNMASSLASLDVQRVVDETPADLAPFGLSAPHLEVAFRLKGQTAFQRLQIGEKTPTGGDVYVKRPDEKRVFLVSSYVDDTFKRTTFDLRDKTLLRFDRDKLTGLELTNASGTMQFERKGANWMFVKPRAMRADFAALEGALTSLSATLMQKYVADSATPAELAQYGLSRPSATASLVTGDSRVTLALGRTDNAETYARDLSKPAIVMVAPTIVADLNKTVNDFRRKELFDLRTFSATRVEITRGSEKIVLDKATADGKETWKNAAGKEVDAVKVNDLLTRLSNIRAQSFEDSTDSALKTPALVVAAQFGENKDENRSETVTLARSGESLVGSRPDEPGTLKIEGTPLDDILKAVDALK